jgi:hypothetical protein
MATRKNVPAKTVRAWAKDNLSTFPENLHASIVGTPGKAGPRGRLHPEVIAAFKKANKSMTYETASEAELPTVTVTIKGTDKAGRPRSIKVTKTNAEARALLGQVGKDGKSQKGRFNLTALTEAVQAEHDDALAAAV